MDTAPITTAPDRTEPREAWTSGLRHRLPMETWVAGCTVLLWVGLALASPYFLTIGNVFNIMRQVSTDAIIAYGELFAIILAGIDLSVGAVAGLTGVVFAMMLSAHIAMPLAIAGALALGLVIGVVNGLAIDRLGIPPFIVTLAGLQGFRGLTLLVSGGMTIAGMPASLSVVSQTSVLGIPTMFVIMLGFAAVSQVLARRHPAWALHVRDRQQRRGGATARHQRYRRDADGLCAGSAVRHGQRHAAGGPAHDGQSECRPGRQCRRSPPRWWAGQACSAGAAPWWDVS